MKFQSVLCPDGLIVSLKGPYHGRRHDAGIFRESNLYAELEQCAVFPDGMQYVLYGDSAYGLRDLLISPYPNRANLTAEQEDFNARMSNVRISVEWGFGNIINKFAFLDYKKNQKILLQNVGDAYKVGVLLANCHVCLYRGQVSHYFNVIPPTLELYLQN